MSTTDAPTTTSQAVIYPTTQGPPPTTISPPDVGSETFTGALPAGANSGLIALQAQANTETANAVAADPGNAGSLIPSPLGGASYASGAVIEASVGTSQIFAGIILAAITNPVSKSDILSSITDTYNTGGTISLEETVVAALYAQIATTSETPLPPLATLQRSTFCWPDTNNVFPKLPFGPCLFATVSGSGVTYTFGDGSPDTIDCKDVDGTEYWNNGIGTKQTIVVGQDFVSTKDTKNAFVTGLVGAGAIDPKCFLEDAPVLTPAGYRKIGTLKVGDLVTTATGGDVAIQSIHKETVAPGKATNPYVIPKGMFGAIADLPISPYHKVVVDGNMIPACNLGLDRKKMTSPFNYYNLELPNYETMIVGGVTVESLLPITRIAVTREEFIAIMKRSYGNGMSDHAFHYFLRNVRKLADGRIELPVDKRSLR